MNNNDTVNIKIDKILERVKEPETFRSVSELNLVKKVTVSEKEKTILVRTEIATPRSTCFVCGLVTEKIRQTIMTTLSEEFHKEFPGYSVAII